MSTHLHRTRPGVFRRIAATVASIVITAVGVLSAEDAPDYARDIQPLLARRCYICHGPSEQESGLALHIKTSATKRAESGRTAIVPGQPSKSELLRRVLTDDAEIRMPPEGPRLTPDEIQKLKSWIAMGAAYSDHWAWKKNIPPRIPKVAKSNWPLNPVDNFVLARLEQLKIAPSPAANPLTLLRRVYLDLTGLPPTPGELTDFANRLTGSPDVTKLQDVHNPTLKRNLDIAYVEIVDRLLASPQFGERWGRHWLDLARYADSFGYERDDVRPNAWRYRDWVIDAFNDDLPFADFATHQLAGDLLPKTSTTTLLAAGLHRMNIKNNESGINKEDYRNREIVDRVNTTATAFLGITIGCSQCHDHKYDPFTQRDFYRLYGLFNNTVTKNVDIPGTPTEQAAYQRALKSVQQHERKLKEQGSVLQAIREAGNVDAYQAKLAQDKTPAEALRALDCDSNLRSAILKPADQRTDQETLQVNVFNTSLRARIDDNNKALRQLSVEKRHLPKPYVMTLAELQDKRRETHILLRGDFKQAGPRVTPGVPEVLGRLEPRQTPGQLDRLDLAHWITSPDNALPRRVAVNRIWQHLFGTALVRTVDDFGMQGSPPSHPLLLEWLAQEFARSGGSRKAVIRQIVLSRTYRQASHHRHDLQTQDPDNQWLARQNRFRVESELVRDLALSTSGLLFQKLGGPTIHPPVSSAIRDLAYKYKTRWIVSAAPERYSRGVYVHFKRTNPFPSLVMFDSPESNVCLAVRNRSNTPLQALTTLNDPVFVEAAQAFARRILNHASDQSSRLQFAALAALGRPLTVAERQTLGHLQATELAFFRNEPGQAQALNGNSESNTNAAAELASWISVARTLINLDEFITRE